LPGGYFWGLSIGITYIDCASLPTLLEKFAP